MTQNRLRIYYGPESDTAATTLPQRPKQRDTVTMPAGEIFPLLAEAVRSERTWLADFDDDEVTISTDLYEVILAYQHFRRPSA